MAIRHFLDIWQLEAGELRAILDEAHAMKAARRGWPKGRVDEGAPLDGHILAMIFEKSSTRTRTSFDVGIRQLGGSSIVLNSGDMQLGRGESIGDTARVLSRYVDMVMIRANDHGDVEDFAEAASVPVINGLTDRSHPCQIMADLMTLEEAGLDLRGARLAWVGDGNNVCSSFIHAGAKFGFSLAIGTPDRYAPDEDDIELAQEMQARVELFDTAEDAVAGADVVVDCVGSSSSLTDAMAVTRPRGRIVLVGMPASVNLELTPLWHRELELVGAYTYGTETLADGTTARTFDLAFDLVRRYDLGRLVSATYPLRRYRDAIQHAAAAGRRGAVKVAFDLRDDRERERL